MGIKLHAFLSLKPNDVSDYLKNTISLFLYEDPSLGAFAE
jgi:hypothetical protein